MQLLKTVLCAAAFLYVINSNLVAAGDSYRSDPKTGSGGDWSQSLDWAILDEDGEWRKPSDEEGVPGEEDDVVVRAGDTMTVDQDATIASLLIEQNASVDYGGAFTLEITDAGGLTIDPAAAANPGNLSVSAGSGFRVLKLTGGDAAAHTVDGEIRLRGSTTFLRIAGGDAQIGGCGIIGLENESASIQIERWRELQINDPLTVIGTGVIDVFGFLGFATLDNRGSVMAAHPLYPGALELGNLIVIEDAPGARWVAGLDPLNILRFGQSVDCMAGDFEVSDGATIIIPPPGITTSGSFTCSKGGAVGGLWYGCNCESGKPVGCKQAMGCDP